MALSKDAVLKRAPELACRLDSNGDCFIELNGETIRAGRHGLLILHVLSTPRTLAEALELLGTAAGGAHEWMELTATLHALHHAGVLREPNKTTPVFGKKAVSFDSAFTHIAMLNDERRTHAFRKAIEHIVRPGDVVVDIGTGTGILALFAARAGARHVYAIEASGISSVARAMFEANGVSDRVTVIEGWSTDVSLPERADVLVSETLGHDPFAENILAIMIDARKRLLHPNARLIPSAVSLFLEPVAASDRGRAQFVFDSEARARWEKNYSVDCSALSRALDQTGLYPLCIQPRDAVSWTKVGSSIPLVDIDFHHARSPSLEATATFSFDCTSRIDGFLIGSKVTLGSDSFVTSIDALDLESSWNLPFWATRDRVVHPGETFVAHFRQTGIRSSLEWRAVREDKAGYTP